MILQRTLHIADYEVITAYCLYIVVAEILYYQPNLKKLAEKCHTLPQTGRYSILVRLPDIRIPLHLTGRIFVESG